MGLKIEVTTPVVEPITSIEQPVTAVFSNEFAIYKIVYLIVPIFQVINQIIMFVFTTDDYYNRTFNCKTWWNCAVSI